jgi:sodium/potassium-transporting ATPase subunit beta
MVEQEYRFEGEAKGAKKDGFGKFLWNGEKKEFLGRSGASWAKIGLCYSIFYFCLASFFIGMLAVFFQIMPMDRPTYFAEESVMSRKGPLNPGLGFRPQIDVEDRMINFNPAVYEKGYKQYTDNLRNFIEAKYQDQEGDLIDCVDGQDYAEELRKGKSCKYDYKKIFAETNCTVENHFGYKTNKVCVLLKLNKIVDFVPKDPENRVTIKCEGVNAVDTDNLRVIKYHSEGNLDNLEGGYLSTKYYPFYGQKNYRAPFVFAEFDVAENVLINIRCKAYAANIDNKDNTSMRGQTSFTFFVETK